MPPQHECEKVEGGGFGTGSGSPHSILLRAVNCAHDDMRITIHSDTSAYIDISPKLRLEIVTGVQEYYCLSRPEEGPVLVQVFEGKDAEKRLLEHVRWYIKLERDSDPLMLFLRERLPCFSWELTKSCNAFARGTSKTAGLIAECLLRYTKPPAGRAEAHKALSAQVTVFHPSLGTREAFSYSNGTPLNHSAVLGVLLNASQEIRDGLGKTIGECKDAFALTLDLGLRY